MSELRRILENETRFRPTLALLRIDLAKPYQRRALILSDRGHYNLPGESTKDSRVKDQIIDVLMESEEYITRNLFENGYISEPNLMRQREPNGNSENLSSKKKMDIHIVRRVLLGGMRAEIDLVSSRRVAFSTKSDNSGHRTSKQNYPYIKCGVDGLKPVTFFMEKVPSGGYVALPIYCAEVAGEKILDRTLERKVAETHFALNNGETLTNVNNEIYDFDWATPRHLLSRNEGHVRSIYETALVLDNEGLLRGRPSLESGDGEASILRLDLSPITGSGSPFMATGTNGSPKYK